MLKFRLKLKLFAQRIVDELRVSKCLLKLSISNEIPTFICTFNNLSYTRQMVDQLQKMGFGSIVILDNSSSYLPFVEYLNQISNVKVLLLQKNYGPRIPLTLISFRLFAPKVFFYTDPDIKLNANLRMADFMEFLSISEETKISKVGVALKIEGIPKTHEIIVNSNLGKTTLYEFESQFWQSRLISKFTDPIFEATIDTTFSLYNRKFKWWNEFYKALRVGGRYTSEHLPWNAETLIPQEEKTFYENLARDSHFGL